MRENNKDEIMPRLVKIRTEGVAPFADDTIASTQRAFGRLLFPLI